MNINSNLPTATRPGIRSVTGLVVGALALAVSACGTADEVTPAGQVLPEANAAGRPAANPGSINGMPAVVYQELVQEQHEAAERPVSRSPWPYRS